MEFITKIRIYDTHGFVDSIGDKLLLDEDNNLYSVVDGDTITDGFISRIDRIEIILVNQKNELIMSRNVDFKEFINATKVY